MKTSVNSVIFHWLPVAYQFFFLTVHFSYWFCWNKKKRLYLELRVLIKYETVSHKAILLNYSVSLNLMEGDLRGIHLG